MKILEWLAKTAALAVVALGSAACEPVALAPMPRAAPATGLVLPMATANQNAVLRAMYPRGAVDAQRGEAVRLLAAGMAHTPTASAEATRAPALSPGAERALKDFAASRGSDAAMMRALKRVRARLDVEHPQ